MQNELEEEWNTEYKRLNPKQKEAVDTIDGPVMVVAGPGTGKTQILALRIGNILLKTDAKADAVLCLTFTNSAVEAMKKRLAKYMGKAGEEVNVSTFHSFGMKIIESYYEVLGLTEVPKLMDGADTTVLFDEILQNNEWEYLRPRSDSGRYFSDLRSLISLLKRELITPEFFLKGVEQEIKSIESNPENISSRGESKGELKKEILTKIEGLNRSKEVVKFFKLYEKAKKNKNVLDYDDVLQNLVKIVEKSPDALADIQERYLYVLVDEHQDSSRVQNEFLKLVWGDLESPDIFVVGDDRQLIYGFSGASIDHFQGFRKTFKSAKLITLVDNYRSTQVILDASHALLRSVMTDEKLVSQSKEHNLIRLFEAEYPHDEIAAAALDIKDKVKEGVKLEYCAILVSKNKEVREALTILHEMGLEHSSLDALNLFDQEDANAFFRVLKIINNSDTPSLALSFFDKLSGISPIEAHKYLSSQYMRDFSFSNLQSETPEMFGGDKVVHAWIAKLSKWKKEVENNDLLKLIDIIGRELLSQNENEKKLVSNQEIFSTILGFVSKEVEKKKDLNLSEFISIIERLENYGEDIPVVVEEKKGVKVMTLHSSKGLEFDYVWIAHLDERSINSGKRMGFVLPEAIAEKVIERDVDKIKRKLYVAITRAKRFCTLSYATRSPKDSDQEMAKVISDLPEEVFVKEKLKSKERKVKTNNNNLTELKKLVTEKYKDKFVSVSLLNNFFECPWKWYFNNLLALPQPENESMVFGSKVHAAIEKILNGGVLEGDKELLSVLAPWVKNRLPEIKTSRKTEEGISIKDDEYPHLKIFGKIDLIENLGPKEVRVTDFKTGSVKTKSDVEKLDDEGRPSALLRQFAMYSYILESSPKWNGTKVRESRLEFLEALPAAAGKKGKSFYDRIILPEDIALLTKDIKDYDQLVTSGAWAERECHYNSYGKGTECEYCKLAEIYKV